MLRSLFAALFVLSLFCGPATAFAPSAVQEAAATDPATQSAAADPAQQVAGATATIENPYPAVGIVAVDRAVEAYVAANAAWQAAPDADKAAAETARTELKQAAIQAIDSAIAAAKAGSAEEQALQDLRFELTGEANDIGAVMRAGQRYLEQAKTWAIDNGPSVLFKAILLLLIYVVFKVLANVSGRVARKGLDTPKIKASKLLKNFLVGVVEKAVMVVGLLVILTQLGIEVGPILAGLGVAGFVIGFALQDTLGNFAAGLMILFYRPFDEGDYVEAGGVAGSVDSISLVSTSIVTPDNQRLIVPNSSIWGGVIRNVTAATTRRVDLMFGIGYGDDMAHAERVLREVVEADARCLKEPAVTIKVHELGESSVNFIVRPWVNKADYWDVYWDLTRKVKEAFDREGISIPFPQRDVHLYRQSSEA